MDIDVSSEEVISLRRKSLELLLSEHGLNARLPAGSYVLPDITFLFLTGILPEKS